MEEKGEKDTWAIGRAAEQVLIGLAGWGDHDSLYADTGVTGRDKLRAYSGHFPVVEVDSSFYAIQSPETFARWAEETPPGFRFVVKAYQGLTGHQRGPEMVRRALAALKPVDPHLRGVRPSPAAAHPSRSELFRAFRDSIAPLAHAGKLLAVLFQYPPWFDCTRENVESLRYARAAMEGLPVALEFRHRSWFAPQLRERTLSFMRKEGWAHSICDEPQAGEGSVPTVLEVTHPDLTVVRFHGRNVAGWNNTGQTDWRDVRYLYHYSETELAEWADRLAQLQRQTARIAVIFNNNSGGHAAGNAKELMQLMDIDYEGLGPRQLDLF
ncbi:DUF72 domain-containing protein [Paenibacillus silviterrae]|uniref:DUF72 domain-containing protein n=1 Tax=Paenibacillus silviterrae TaxID=3242194 RepID=UPI002543D76F|nr:DUF72 domain-containing protein [Paenibacillus chinjuensis]